VTPPALKGFSRCVNASLPNANRANLRREGTGTTRHPRGRQGNLYTNYTHGFRMYKAPSWQIMEMLAARCQRNCRMGTQTNLRCWSLAARKQKIR